MKPGAIIDYIAWGGDVGPDDDAAVAVGQWYDGVFIDTSEMFPPETIGRDKDSNDTNTPFDWENETTTRADPYGVNATEETPGGQNLDSIIPEFPTLAIPLLFLPTLNTGKIH